MGLGVIPAVLLALLMFRFVDSMVGSFALAVFSLFLDLRARVFGCHGKLVTVVMTFDTLIGAIEQLQ